MLRQFTKDQLLLWANSELLKAVKTNKAGLHRGYVSYCIENVPSCACVILRSYDFASRKLSFHTDIRSSKAAAIESNPLVSFLAYDKDLSLQVRFNASAKIHHMNDRTQDKWNAMLDMSKRCYMSEFGPGRQLPHSSHHMIGSDTAGQEKAYENFAIIECQFNAMDVLFLSHKAHLRCAYKFEHEKVISTWLAP